MQDDRTQNDPHPDTLARMQMLADSQAGRPQGRQTTQPEHQKATAVTPESKTPAPERQAASTD